MDSWFPTSVADAVLWTPLRIVFIIVVGLVARAVIVRVINRTVRSATRRLHTSGDSVWSQQLRRLNVGSAERRGQRLGALASLATSSVTVLIVVIVTAIVLSELNFNVTSLVAGGTLIVAAISFGMQNVIKDLVSGVFLLIEDQLGVGDWVRLEGFGEATGQVIEVGLRITRLRLDDGTIIAVRNGELFRVTNYSQGGPGKPEPPAEEIVDTA